MTLWELKPNQSCQIASVSGTDNHTLLKMQDLGVRTDEQAKCIQWIPFGGPRLYQLQNGIFAIEKSIAECVDVKVVP